jgi:hypothetical protein
MAKGSGGLGDGIPEPSSEGMSSEGASTPLFVASGSYGLKVGGEYDPGITPEIDKKIRHLPFIVDYVTRKAYELQRDAGDNFEVILSNKPDQQRPRAYVCPRNNAGIRQELSDAVLLKSALGFSGR